MNSDVLILPPVRVRPWDDARPPPATLMPELEKVEVAEEVLKIDPAVMVRPFDAWRLPALSPPVNVEVPEERAPSTSTKPVILVEVAVLEDETTREPPEMVRPEEVAVRPDVMSP